MHLANKSASSTSFSPTKIRDRSNLLGQPVSGRCRNPHACVSFAESGLAHAVQCEAVLYLIQSALLTHEARAFVKDQEAIMNTTTHDLENS